ncbi:MAG TPA: hypothetical protein VG871_23910 [Vicinamibacterales bacterium]|nr:hypothetical protein [Vicinamibacterales bacterium]
MISALIVGALTAWYLGLRLGVIVAVATAIALVVSSVVPGMRLAVYVLVLGWAAALYFFGPKISKATGKSSMFGTVGGSIQQARGWAKRFMGRKQP